MGNFLMRIFIALAFGIIALNASADSAGIQILDPWVRAAPPGIKVLAAYLEMKNIGEKPQILIGITSPAFDHVGIHRSVIRENMAHMEQQSELTIPPHTSVILKPGGMHLMLVDAKNPLRVGDAIPITLTFKNGEKITLIATIRIDQTEDTGTHQHMNHTEHKNLGH